MTKIERLKLRFASGMSEGRISSDEWELEFLPMLADAARYQAMREGVMDTDGTLRASFAAIDPTNAETREDFDLYIDAAIDAARTPTKE